MAELFLNSPLLQAVVKIAAIVLGFVMLTGTLLTLMERKWMSAVQDRIGPNRANVGKLKLHGLFHILSDGLKSMFKEDTVPAGANRLMFAIAPYFAFLSVIVMWAVIPVAAPVGDFKFQIADLDIGLLLVFAFTSLGVYGAVLGGWSSNNKFALLGATRASAQMLSYEIFLGLSLVGVFMVNETLSVGQIVLNQGEHWWGWIPKWGIFTQPFAFVMFFVAMLAEIKRQPFDAPEGESEIVAGYFLEYSGMRWSAFVLAEYVGIVGVGALTTTLFLGGYHLPWLGEFGIAPGGVLWLALPGWLIVLLQIGAFAAKTLFFCWLIIILRWSIPRFRFDQIMHLGWKRMLPLALANIAITALVLLIYDSWIF